MARYRFASSGFPWETFLSVLPGVAILLSLPFLLLVALEVRWLTSWPHLAAPLILAGAAFGAHRLARRGGAFESDYRLVIENGRAAAAEAHVPPSPVRHLGRELEPVSEACLEDVRWIVLDRSRAEGERKSSSHSRSTLRRPRIVGTAATASQNRCVR